jgi:outer membrane protein TolC
VAATIDLHAAIDSAMRNNEGYHAALAERERAEGQITSARAGLFPKIDLHGTYDRNLKLSKVVFGGQEFTIGTRYTTVGGLTIDQTLFEGGGVFSAWAAARQYRSMEEHLASQAGLDLQADVASAYFDALLANALVDVAQQTFDLAEKNATVVKQKFDQGLVSEYDQLRSQVRVANARPPLLQAKNNETLALLRLKNLIGLPVDADLSLDEAEPDSSAWEGQTLDQLAALAINQRSDLAATGHQVAAIDRAIGVVKAERWPSLHFNGTFDYQALTDASWPGGDDFSKSWIVGLNLSYSLFDGFRRHGNIQILKVDRKEADLQRGQLLRLISLQIEDARSRFAEASERLAAQEQTVGEAQRGLDIANLRYESGVGTQLEVIDAQVELATARVYVESARHDRRIARVAWRRAMGAPILESLPIGAK